MLKSSWGKALLGSVVLILSLFTTSPASADEGDKPGGLLSAAAKNGKGETTVTGTRQTAGSSSGRGTANSPGRRDSGSNAKIGNSPRQSTSSDGCGLAGVRTRLGCWDVVVLSDAERAERASSSGVPPITITDLASFSPAKGTVLGEPDNLGVAGLPTNFVTEAATHVRSGELFGFPVDVRFTPVAYTFHYGHGKPKTTSSPGASWESLSQAQFTPTDTSHTYAARGTYDARVDIAYTAEIDLGAGWFPVEGRLDIAGPTQQIRIFEARTALVARTCAEQPSAPGC